MSSPEPCSEPLAAARLEQQVREFLAPVLSPRRTAAALAQGLATLARREQDFALHWVGVIARSSAEMAYRFAAAAPQALAGADLSRAEAWIVEAMDIYDRDGLHRVGAALNDFAAFSAGSAAAATLDEVAPWLERFLCGLSGRRLRIDAAEQCYTDTETIHLPPRIALYPSREMNLRLYKASAVHQWAQIRFGTFSRDLGAALAHHAEPAAALALLNALETLRLDACLARALPGLARELRELAPAVPTTDPRLQRLLEPGARLGDSLRLVDELGTGYVLPAPRYTGLLRPETVAQLRAARLARERDALRAWLARLLESESGAQSAAVQIEADVDCGVAGRVALTIDGRGVAAPPELAALLRSIVHDLGAIPGDYLVAVGAAGDLAAPDAEEPALAEAESPAHVYPEWDFRRRHYRRNWCILRERESPAPDTGFVDATLAKYRPRIAQLRRTFERMRGEDRLLKRQPHGDDIDLDAAVSACAELRAGDEFPQQVLIRRARTERSMAVMFLVDMSGSTKGWVNECEREALVLLCEALEVLGDRYAAYGFSGSTRRRCELFRIKRFDEPYGDAVKRRIAGIAPQDYTRMGAPIRHLTRLIEAIDARTKLLITLSDGKPDDRNDDGSDDYRGEYGIEDTRQALIEARRSRIHPFCITIDREARDYLPHMYGAAHYAVIDDVVRLPLEVADIYRKLTT